MLNSLLVGFVYADRPGVKLTRLNGWLILNPGTGAREKEGSEYKEAAIKRHAGRQ